MSKQTLANLVNDLADILCNDRGASNEEILSKARELRGMHNKLKAIKNWPTIYKAINKMHSIAISIDDELSGNDGWLDDV